MSKIISYWTLHAEGKPSHRPRLDIDLCWSYTSRRRDRSRPPEPRTVVAIKIYHTLDLGLWLRCKWGYVDGWDPSDVDKLVYGRIFKQIPREVGEREL